MSSRAKKAPNPWWVGVVSGMASYIDAAAIISFGIAIVIFQSTLGLDEVQVGVGSAILTCGIAVGALLGGKLGDTFGRRPVFSVTMIVILIGVGLLIVADSFALVVVGGALVGLGTGADLPVSLSTIAEAATDKNRGAIVTFSNVLWSVGAVAAILTGTAVGNLGRVGAQILFAHIGVVTLLVLIGRLTIPESDTWLAARAARAAGATLPSSRGAVSALLRSPYLAPLAALSVFYALVNLGYNTFGQFGAYLLVNVAQVDVSTASSLTLIGIPIGIIGILWFMKVVGTSQRFLYFTGGAIASVAGLLVPAVFGFSVATYLVCSVLLFLGASFAGEAIMKIWAQEQFPTLLRTTAQGTVIAVARFVAAAGATVTPLIIGLSPRILFLILTVISVIGLSVAWVVFRTRHTHNEFETESAVPSEQA